MIRVDKALSRLQLASRSQCRQLVKEGRLRIGEKLVTNPAQKSDEDSQTRFLDDAPVAYTTYEYWMLNKPAGCITATRDEKEQTVMDFLPREHQREVAPVGRLDKDTVGLLLLTNDGQLAHELLSPTKHIEKVYYAAVKGRVNEETIAAFKEGLSIGQGEYSAPARLQILSAGEESEVRVTITEGKFHQIKRMFHAVGMEVLYLQRIRMGSLRLDFHLQPGQCRKLTKEEIFALKHPEAAQKQAEEAMEEEASLL